MEFAERKNHRLKNYDYGTYGYYHVTICTHHRFHLLSDVVGDNAQVILSDIGKKVSECWNNIALLNPNVELDQYVIMPTIFMVLSFCEIPKFISIMKNHMILKFRNLQNIVLCKG